MVVYVAYGLHVYVQYFNDFLKQSELVMIQISDFIHFASGI